MLPDEPLIKNPTEDPPFAKYLYQYLLTSCTSDIYRVDEVLA